MKIIIILALVFFIWIAFDLLWSLATLVLFVLLIVATVYVGYKIIKAL